MSSPASQTHSEGTAEKAKQTGPAPARILLVDDDPVNQVVALGLLRRRGWQAVAAGNGREALRILAGQSFDLILMDLQMPEMDGYQTASVIRQNEARSLSVSPARESTDTDREMTDPPGERIPIIALTTASQPGVREKCLAAGMDDYLTKPVSPRDLYAAVEKYLGSGH